MKRLIILIAFSVLLHALATSGLITLADLFPPNTFEPTTEIELVETPTDEVRNLQRAIVKQLEPLNPVKDDDTPALFESEKKQRVAQQTRTQNLGVSQNPTQNQPRGNSQRQPPPEQNADELPEFTRMTYGNPNRAQNQVAAFSQSLPNEISLSNATNLNTDANTYYSFYSRVEELFYGRWGQRLNYYWDRLSFEFKKNQLAGHVWSTTLEVWLTSTGEYHSAKIFKSSGYPPFDEAAVFAFKDARFFPNPPKDKVEDDGFIRLRYRLSVHIGNL